LPGGVFFTPRPHIDGTRAIRKTQFPGQSAGIRTGYRPLRLLFSGASLLSPSPMRCFPPPSPQIFADQHLPQTPFGGRGRFMPAFFAIPVTPPLFCRVCSTAQCCAVSLRVLLPGVAGHLVAALFRCEEPPVVARVDPFPGALWHTVGVGRITPYASFFVFKILSVFLPPWPASLFVGLRSGRELARAGRVFSTTAWRRCPPRLMTAYQPKH